MLDFRGGNSRTYKIKHLQLPLRHFRNNLTAFRRIGSRAAIAVIVFAFTTVEVVVTIAAADQVVATFAFNEVIAAAPEDNVISRCADQDVIVLGANQGGELASTFEAVVYCGGISAT